VKSSSQTLIWAVVFLFCLSAPAVGQEKTATSGLGTAGPIVHGTPEDPLRDPRETHLRHVKQLTFGGQNAEAYFSYDGRRLIFMSTREPYKCDQIFVMNSDGSDQHLVSTSEGRTTCGYFYADGKHILYSSTHAAAKDCPPRADYSHGYVWGVYPEYQIYYATDAGKILSQLTDGPGYNAEATISADGKKIVFTSSRDGNLEIYAMNADGSEAKRLTHALGYDGGPFFSPDGEYSVKEERAAEGGPQNLRSHTPGARLGFDCNRRAASMGAAIVLPS